MARSSIYKLVDPWKRVTILWCGFIEISKVHTHSIGLVLLLDKDNVRDPCRILNMTHEARFQAAVDRGSYCFLAFRGKSSFLLLDGATTRVEIKAVGDDSRVYALEVLAFPREDVQVGAQELLVDLLVLRPEGGA